MSKTLELKSKQSGCRGRLERKQARIKAWVSAAAWFYAPRMYWLAHVITSLECATVTYSVMQDLEHPLCQLRLQTHGQITHSDLFPSPMWQNPNSGVSFPLFLLVHVTNSICAAWEGKIAIASFGPCSDKLIYGQVHGELFRVQSNEVVDKFMRWS